MHDTDIGRLDRCNELSAMKPYPEEKASLGQKEFIPSQGFLLTVLLPASFQHLNCEYTNYDLPAI